MIVSDPEAIIHVAGERIRLREIAARYLPVFYVHPRLGDMRPLQVLYEAEPLADSLRLNYYVHWIDEIAPNPLWHRVYRVFRSIYYGSAEDIEFIQIVVSTASGCPVSMTFERDPAGRPDVFAPLHQLAVATRVGDEEDFSVTINGRAAPSVRIADETGRLPVLVSIWNHIYDFYRGEGIRMEDAPLRPMTDQFYKKYCMSRRSLPPGR